VHFFEEGAAREFFVVLDGVDGGALVHLNSLFMRFWSLERRLLGRNILLLAFIEL
jgi:hypothetical protein